MLRMEFPNALFDGAVMSPGVFAEVASQLLSVGFLGTIASMFAGEYILPAAAAAVVKDNKGTAFAVAMAMNMAAGKLVSTGAFEILANGIPIHSKVAQGFRRRAPMGGRARIEPRDCADRVLAPPTPFPSLRTRARRSRRASSPPWMTWFTACASCRPASACPSLPGQETASERQA